MTATHWVIMFLGVLVATALLMVVGNYYYNPNKIDLTRPGTGVRPDSQQPQTHEVSDESIARLEKQLQDPDSQNRLEAIFLLMDRAEDEPARLGPILVKALDHNDPHIRSAAALGLGNIKYAPGVGDLTRLLDDGNELVRLQAAQSLIKFGQVGLESVMQALSRNSIDNVDSALMVATRITGRYFGRGESGRKEAVKFWASYRFPKD